MHSIPKWALPALILVAGGFFLGRWIPSKSSQAEPAASQAAEGGGPAVENVLEATDWTCAMHHQIHMPGPGKCPICGMELIPSQTLKEGPVGLRAVQMSPEAMALADIQTVPVQRRQVAHEVRMVGKVAIDETRLAYLTAWVPGRLDRLFVDYTGVTVRKGDHMVEIYSPDLYATQKELLVGVATGRKLAEKGMEILRESTKRQNLAARERLRLWGLTPEQIGEILERGTPEDHVELVAPMGGIVIHKNALEGMYVKEGTRIYTIADLTKVWVELDAYEADLSWLRYGEDVEFQTEAYPGEVFHGRIAFIDPVLDDRTRTVRVRLNVENKAMRLKPEMFVRATIHASLTQGGKVLDPSLAGKWMGPMHPEVISDKPGKCPECGMDLVLAEDLGFVDAGEPEPSLVIPSTAPLITGKRSVVYVQLPDRKMPTFEGRDVVLGPRAGDWYVVREGLQEGEQVVVEGNFKIDSELQIRGKPSMMNPTGGGRAPGMAGMAGMGKKKMDAPSGAKEPPPSGSPAPPAFQKELGALVAPYLELQAALAGDDADAAGKAVRNFAKRFSTIDMGLLSGPAHENWMKVLATLQKTADSLASKSGLPAQRVEFERLSQVFLQALDQFGFTGAGKPVGVYHCPMALDGKGADWIQPLGEVRNPYLGQAMPHCGDPVRTLKERP